MTTLVGQRVSPFKTAAYQYIRSTDKLPRIADVPDNPLCTVKLFGGPGTWWIAGFDPETGDAYGVAEIQEREAGYFNVNEIVDLRIPPFGLPVERDLYYQPERLRDLIGLD